MIGITNSVSTWEKTETQVLSQKLQEIEILVKHSPHGVLDEAMEKRMRTLVREVHDAISRKRYAAFI